MKESLFKVGDIVSIKSGNIPHVITRVQRIAAWDEEFSCYDYWVRRCDTPAKVFKVVTWVSTDFRINEWEMELYKNQLRDDKLKQIGI